MITEGWRNRDVAERDSSAYIVNPSPQNQTSFLQSYWSFEVVDPTWEHESEIPPFGLVRGARARQPVPSD